MAVPVTWATTQKSGTAAATANVPPNSPPEIAPAAAALPVSFSATITQVGVASAADAVIHGQVIGRLQGASRLWRRRLDSSDPRMKPDEARFHRRSGNPDMLVAGPALSFLAPLMARAPTLSFSFPLLVVQQQSRLLDLTCSESYISPPTTGRALGYPAVQTGSDAVSLG
jgi:hypothetical protein